MVSLHTETARFKWVGHKNEFCFLRNTLLLMHREEGTGITTKYQICLLYEYRIYSIPSIVPKVVEKYRVLWKILRKAELARQAMPVKSSVVLKP